MVRSVTRRYPFNDDTIAGAFEGLRSDYNAAKSSRYRRRRTGVSSAGSGADYHYRSDADYLRMMELSRDFARNDPVVGQGVTRLVDNVLQDGFRLDVQTGDPKLDADLAARWKVWSCDPERCDDAGEHDFDQLVMLALRQTIVDGDFVFLPLRGGTLESIEAHRVRTPTNTKQNVVHGVLMDGRRRRLEYWVASRDLDPQRALRRVGDVKRVPVRDGLGNRQVFHVYNPRRVSQTRGVTALAPIVDMIGIHDDIQFAKLVQQQIVSCFAIFRERDAELTPGPTPQTGDQTREALSGGGTRTIQGIAPGLEITGLPGEKLHGFSPNVPNPEFFPHAMLILTFVAVNLNLPLAVLLLDPTKTNFSGWRGAVDQARTSFRVIQKWMAAKVHGPVYRWKLRQWANEDPALARAARRDEVGFFGHRWNPPTWSYIEPLKDASADDLRQRSRLISPRRLHNERGRDWDDISTEIVEDNASIVSKAKQHAMEINQNPKLQDGDPVGWRELASMPTPASSSGSEPEPGHDLGDTADGGDSGGSGGKPKEVGDA